MQSRSILDIRGGNPKMYVESEELSLAADPIVEYANAAQLEKMIADTEKKMKAAAKDLDFLTAAQYRDEMQALKKKLKEKTALS